jgi:hypothetical protein
MAVFTPFGRRRSTISGQAPGWELPGGLLPHGFEAVREALVSGTDVVAACALVGHHAARDGTDLGEALAGLRVIYSTALGHDPDFVATQALAMAWSEATLGYLHGLSCRDPLTGLASLTHVHTRLSELYREAERRGASMRTSHALILVETRLPDRHTDPERRLTRALGLVPVAESLHTVFSGGETIGRLRPERAVAVVPREPGLGASVALLRELLASTARDPARSRVWIEGLPGSAVSAARLLDELSRSS